ncbi:MAG: hypothetical protein IKS67_03120 [Victivallales bacterium]|nr:hypothetical protein [Victivallales bacterium]
MIKKESGWPPSARRFVTLRGSANNVMRKLEVHRLLARQFVTLRGSANNVMRKFEVHGLSVQAE